MTRGRWILPGIWLDRGRDQERGGCAMTRQAPEGSGRPFDVAQGRRSIRLKGYDYSLAGGYSITIVTQLRESFFGKICGGEMIFNDAGRMVIGEWASLQERFPNIEMDVFQVMPNHLHGIIIIHNPELVGAGRQSPAYLAGCLPMQ